VFAPIDRTGDSLATITPLAPAAESSVSALAFGSYRVGATTTHVMSVTDRGAGPLSIDDATISGPGRADFGVSLTCQDMQSGVAAHALRPGKSCLLPVTFTPSAAGARSAVLTIATNAGPIVIPLSGTGTVARAKLSKLRLTRSTFAAGSKVSVSFRSDRAGRATFKVLSLAHGTVRAVGASFTRTTKAGTNRFTFDGRVRRGGKLVKLVSGRYRLEATGAGTPTRVSFRIVGGHR
jgi:hypothetical protein